MTFDQASLLAEIEKEVPQELRCHLTERDGAATLSYKLPQFYKPEQIVIYPSVEQRVWELVGLFYFNQPNRYFEALGIFLALYQHMLDAQVKSLERVHKGMPLLWAAECFALAGYAVLRKRFLMLALCEDAIRGKGVVAPESTGVYFRLVWRLGMTDAALKRYAEECIELARQPNNEAQYPEWVLQRLDQDWMTEFPNPAEANVYAANTRYVKSMLTKFGNSAGTALEELAEYVMLCMPGCRTSRRKASMSTDYDLVCSMEGFDVDFRSELGRYFVCECKDWSKPADFTSMAKFCRVLDSVKCKFGILFSQEGISGAGNARYAQREQLKVFQDRGMVIVVIDQKDLGRVAEGANFVNILRNKYEQVRLDLLDLSNGFKRRKQRAPRIRKS
jgi:hypothetical protein